VKYVGESVNLPLQCHITLQSSPIMILFTFLKQTMEKMRLQKFLASNGVASRRAIERMILEKRIVIGSHIAVIGEKVNGTESIKIDGKKFEAKPKQRKLLAFNKPRGVTCTMASEDPDGRQDERTLAYYNFGEDRVYPVGRLDKESHGLLLITNDGDLANELTHPKYEHEKEYVVSVDRTLTPAVIEKLGNGSIVLEGKKVAPAEVEVIDEKTFRIVLKEGRNRQIRKMCDAVKMTVRNLGRVRIADIELGEITPGQYRNLDPAVFMQTN